MKNKTDVSLLEFFTQGQLEYLDSLLTYLEKLEATAQTIQTRRLKIINDSAQINQLLLDKTLDKIESINKRLKSEV